MFYSNYDFELFSNFTFFLIDPINGDQIRQKENRNLFGLKSEYLKAFDKESIDGTWTTGISLRYDNVQDNELSNTLNRRETLQNLSLGDVGETNIAAYAGAKINLQKWTFNSSIRLDYFDFIYQDDLSPSFSRLSNNTLVVSPKLNVLYNASSRFQLYVKSGRGFHSNDARVVTSNDMRELVPTAFGTDVGFIWKPTNKMFINAAYWYLFLEQEFVYVGDAGIVEPSGRTRRQGIELSYRYQPSHHLFWTFDINYTHARSIDEQEGDNFIPLAPDLTLVSGINYTHNLGLYGSLQFRYIKDRPANEDNSIVAEGYGVTDLNLGYKRNRLDFGLQIQNLFDTEWNETQFATETRLFDESQPVDEIHFTPGTPFFIKFFLQYSF